MQVLVTGATGLVGRALVQRLLGGRHRVLAAVRDVDAARARLGPDVQTVRIDDDAALVAAMGSCAAVVNLAGEPILGGPLRGQRRRAVVESRVGLTQRLVVAMERARTRPAVMVSASAIGWYGDRGDAVVDEDASTGTGWLAELCRDWELAATEATRLGVRVAIARIGVVLGADGGALGRLLPVFRTGLGGPIGRGRQFMSWILLDDLVEMLMTAVTDARWSGAFNATAPLPVTNRQFTRALARAVRRPAFVPVPPFALRLVFGAAAEVLTGGQRVMPGRATELGFRFRCRDLDSALAALLADEDTVKIERARDVPDNAYLRERGATYRLAQDMHVAAPLDAVFAFFCRAENLGLITPAFVSWRIEGGAPPSVGPGTALDYSIGLGPFRLRWRTLIESFEPGRVFTDSQQRGPYRAWWHEHRFEAAAGGATVRDQVFYRMPLGPLGRLIHALIVGPTLRRIFAYRHEAIARLFGERADGDRRAAAGGRA